MYVKICLTVFSVSGFLNKLYNVLYNLLTATFKCIVFTIF